MSAGQIAALSALDLHHGAASAQITKNPDM
jgi:hypothetical protein